MMKFLSSEVFPTVDHEDSGSDVFLLDYGSETIDRVEKTTDEDFDDSEKNDDIDEYTNYFEILHSNFAPSRRLKHLFFEAETLVDFVCFVCNVMCNSIEII